MSHCIIRNQFLVKSLDSYMSTLNILSWPFTAPHNENHHYYQDENQDKCYKYSENSTHNWTCGIPSKKEHWNKLAHMTQVIGLWCNMMLAIPSAQSGPIYPGLHSHVKVFTSSTHSPLPLQLTPTQSSTLVRHKFPVKPGLHTQMKLSTPSTHWPPSPQGFNEQSLMLISQFSPVKPASQSHT